MSAWANARPLLDDGQFGLRYFPDGGVALLTGGRWLVAAGISSYLLVGPDVTSLHLVKKVLEPGPKGAFDNGYAGIFGAYVDPRSREILAVYHAEDQEDMARLSNRAPGFYASIALAISGSRGSSFRKVGRIITSPQAKDPGGRADQGCGEPSILADKDGRYLYCYYTEHSRIGNRGVQICLARSAIANRGMPGSWKKYYEGGFDEPGLGGRDTPVLSALATGADAIFPQVSYAEALGRYLMVLNLNYYRELAAEGPARSGIYTAISTDGIHWSTPTLVLRSYAVAQTDREVAWHPTIVWDGKGQPGGWLVYGYSPRWGHGAGRKAHYLAGQRIVFGFNPDRR